MGKYVGTSWLVRCSLVVSLGLLLAVPALAQAGSESDPSDAASEPSVPFLGGFLKGTRILYPMVAGKWKAGGENRYDSQEAGVSVRFKEDTSNRWVDLYIFPVGVLTEEQLKSAVDAERNALISIRLPGPDGEKNISTMRRYEITRGTGEDADRLPAFSLDLAYDIEGGPRSSAMVLVYDRLYLLKARYDIEQDGKRAEARRELEAFVATVVPQLEISSFGTCWSPLPIAPLIASQPVPEGSILSMQTDGVTTEYVFPDRVLAQDPGSISAQSAALLGMAMQDRMYAGCDGSEPSELAVAEGMREIRIEYHPPAK